jgi:hypothetical protein
VEGEDSDDHGKSGEYILTIVTQEFEPVRAVAVVRYPEVITGRMMTHQDRSHILQHLQLRCFSSEV